MENLGYKEGFAKQKKGRAVRRNSKISGEDVPLFATNQKYKFNSVFQFHIFKVLFQSQVQNECQYNVENSNRRGSRVNDG